MAPPPTRSSRLPSLLARGRAGFISSTWIVRTVIYNDVTRDGMLAGPDIEGARGLAALGLDVVVSGGVGSLDDLRAVAAAKLAGACVGRALYDGRFSIAEALACIS